MSDHSVLKFHHQLFTDRVSAENKFKWDKGDYNNFRNVLDINWDDALDRSTNATVDDGKNLRLEY